MWNLSVLFDTSESGDGEKWRTVLSSHPTPRGRELGQPCSCWSYMNAHQCPQLLGIQSSISCLPPYQGSSTLHSAVQVPGTDNLRVAVPCELKPCFPLRQQRPLERDTCFHTTWKHMMRMTSLVLSALIAGRALWGKRIISFTLMQSMLSLHLHSVRTQSLNRKLGISRCRMYLCQKWGLASVSFSSLAN